MLHARGWADQEKSGVWAKSPGRAGNTEECEGTGDRPGLRGKIRMPGPKNVLGLPLETCCTEPMTGFYRTGRCETGPDDLGLHLVCARMTREFLAFSRSRGNDLTRT